MNYLLDTNVVSEWAKLHPDPGVVSWLAEADEDRVFLSVISLAELRHGVERMPAGRRRNRLDSWLKNELVSRFEDRMLPVDRAIADTWGGIVARAEAMGRPIAVMDGFIAATAEAHAMALVTRNDADFKHLLREIINPWEAQ